MKGIVVEIATLINAPPQDTTRATPDTLRSGISISSIIGISAIIISTSITIGSIIGISSTLTMGNNWYIAYHTCF